LIKCEDLHVSYGKKEVLKHISLTIPESKITAIMGRTGCGKTTLLYALAGIIPNIIEAEVKGSVDRRHDSFFVFQNVDDQLLGTTCGEVVEVLAGRKVDPAKYMGVVGLDVQPDDDPFELSFGQKQLLVLASALASKKQILFLDEPTYGLDWEQANQLYKNLKKSGLTIVVAEHDSELVHRYADGLVVLADGKVFANGQPAELLKKKEVGGCGIKLI